MTSTDLVRTFIAAWEARDIEALMACLSTDALYENVGLSRAVGHVEIRSAIAPFLAGASAVEWTVRHIAETADGVVLTERIDVFRMGERTLEIPVMGVFEVADGKISAWRDYFDLPGFQRQMA